MITFTRCTFMAKQACATFSQVVQKITPPIANNFLKFFFALFATLTLNAATAWGAEVTLWDKDNPYVASVSEKTSSDGVVKWKNSASNTYSGPTRIYKNDVLTITASNKIVKVQFVCAASDTEKYGPGHFSSNVGTYNYSGTLGTWKGEANSIEFTASGGQVRIHSVTVTYESATPAQKYKLTYQAGSVIGALEVEEGANLLEALKDITPVACDPTSTEPIGWSESEITTKQTNEPTLLTDADVMPSEEHSVYYLFAKKETIDGGVVNNNAFSATLGGSSGDNISSGYVLTKAAEAKAGYYQDGSGDVRYVQIISTSPMFTSTPNSITVTAKIGGGTGNKTLSNPVEAQLVDKDGNLIGSAVTITKKITTNTGDSYEVNVPTTGITSAYGLRISHKKESGYNVRYYSMSLSYTTSGTSTIFTDYTTSCGSAPDVIVRTLKSIAVTGMKQNFVEGDEFTFGGTCSATYSVTKNDVAQDDETVTVTPTSITGYNMSNPGEQTITVSYTEGSVTKTTEYQIIVTAKPSYAIIWRVNGVKVSGGTTTVKEGNKVTELPTTPTFSCDNTKQFVGWTTTSINGTTDDKPAVLFTEAENAPVVTAETTYHAVFATVTGSGTAGWEQTTTVAVGDQVVIAQVDHGTKEMTGLGKTPETANNNYGEGTDFTTNPNGTLIWTVEEGNAPGQFSFNNGTYYLNLGANENYLSYSATKTATSSWTISTSSERAVVTNANYDSRKIMWNKNNTRFASYSKNHGDNNGQYYYHIVFYKKSGGSSYSAYQTSCATLESIALSGNYKTTFTVGDDFVFAGKVIATYDNRETKDVTNAATLSPHNLTATGTQEVTVSYTEGGVTETATYTITINAAKVTGTFQQYTGELVEGDYVVYYQKDSESDGYAMKAAVSSDRLVAAVAGTDFTKESDIITNPDRSLVWHIAPSGSNWTIYNDKTGKYAAGTGAANKAQLLVRDDEGKILWTASDKYEFVNVHNADKGVNKKLRNNGNYGFACYATGTGGALSLYKYTEGVISAPTITGELEFVGSTQVSITASTGDIYYTTDGNAPTTSSNKYTAPFTINATTTVKAIAHKDGISSSVAEKKFTKRELLSVADAMALGEDKVAYLNQFEVVKVIKNDGYIFIKDATGAGLIYDKDNAKGMESLVEGASVSGFIGTKDLFYNHPQLTPNVAYSDLTVTGSGTVVATEITELKEADLNKYVVLKGVTFATATNISSNPTNNGIKYRAQFGSSYQFEVGTSYDIYGFVGKYNDDLRFWFLEAAVAGSTVERYSVTYAKGEGDVQGTLPVDNETYPLGAKVTLKDHSLTRAGYSFTGWKVTDANSNEITVTSNQFNMPAANVTVTAQWEVNLDFNTGYWVLVEKTDQLSAGNYVVIAAAEAAKAMLSYASGSNCKATTITKNGKLMTFGATAPGIFQLENGDEGTFAFRDIANTTADEYLYASSTSDNELKSSTSSTLGNKKWFSIYVSEGVATIKNPYQDTRNWLRFNQTASPVLFSCYTSGQSDVALYKYMTMPTPVFSLPTGNYVGAQTITVDCAISNATIYYTTDGTTPTTSSASVAVGGSINIPTTCTLKAIAVEGTNKSEVESATYTLVTDGVWTLVRDAAELQDGDLVVMASNAKGVVNGANAKSEYFTTASVTFTDDEDYAAITSFSNDALIFTLKKATNDEWLLASGNNYVDLHGDKQNALVTEPSTTWTISVDKDFNATIANGSLMFRYNSRDTRFKAYAKTTGTLPQLYKLVKTYTRIVNAGEYGTICLPGQANRMSGAIFYELAGRDTKFAYLDEVTELEAGTPYIFYATSNTLTVTYNGTKAANAEENVNGMYGTFTKIIDTEPAGSAKNILEGNYVVYNNELLLCGTGCGLFEYRAYVNVDEISTNVPAAVPGRRRVSMGVQGENTTTDFENITNGENNTIKVIENGQLFIIRNGEKYNIQGQKL